MSKPKNYTRKKLSIAELDKIANNIRKSIITMLEAAGSGHTAGPLGMADIVTALYFDIMTHDPDFTEWDERDILLQSNGHTVPVRYAAMAESGYFSKKELKTLRKLGTRLQGHPERTKLPGLENTSGPLGSGLSQAAGMALALKMQNQKHRWVYCILGDGEQNEGNVWEAAMFTAKYKLDNVIAITDRNYIQIDGATEDVMPMEDLKAKWEAFGWHVIDINGNDIEAVIDACAMARAVIDRPSMIIAHNVAGKGVDFMEYDFHWHGMMHDKAEAKEAMRQLRSMGGKITGEHE